VSETKDDVAATAAKDPAVAPAAGTPERLSDLMAAGAKAPAPATPDLDAEALRAAEAALAEGERALAAARAQLAPRQKQKRRSTSGREIALRLLLAANVLAMVVVASLPTPIAKEVAVQTTANQPAPLPATAPTTNEPMGPVAPAPRLDDPYVQAIVAAERRDYPAAITLLEHYLDAQPRLAPGSQLNVLMMLAHYNQLVGKFDAAREYERRAQAIAQSHSLPDDLVAMAKAAQASGDQEALRRVWARFLLQQKQIPSSLFQHVAEAYLQLGDSYRNQANAAAERQRLRDLEALNARVRAGIVDGGRK
jgi:TolA-binding protein